MYGVTGILHTINHKRYNVNNFINESIKFLEQEIIKARHTVLYGQSDESVQSDEAVLLIDSKNMHTNALTYWSYKMLTVKVEVGLLPF